MSDAPNVSCEKGHTNPVGQRYCGECGESLAGLCPNGHTNRYGQRFCGECGTPIIAAPNPSEAGPAESNAETTGDPFGPRFRVNDDGIVQDIDARVAEPPPEAAPPPKQSPTGAGPGSPDSMPLRVGTTFTTRDGSQATITRISGNDVWLGFDGVGEKLGPLRYSRKDVEIALAAAKSYKGNVRDGKPRQATPTGSAVPPRKPAGASNKSGKKPTPSATPQNVAQPGGKGGLAAFGIHPLAVFGIAIAIVACVVAIVLAVADKPESPRRSSSGGSSRTTTAGESLTFEERNYLARIRSRTAASWTPWPDDATLLEQGRIICSDLGNHHDLMWQAEVMGYISWHPDAPPLPNQDKQAEFQILEAMSYLCNGVR